MASLIVSGKFILGSIDAKAFVARFIFKSFFKVLNIIIIHYKTFGKINASIKRLTNFSYFLYIILFNLELISLIVMTLQ